VGAILSAHLLQAGHIVLMVDAWKEHLERIRVNGLRITGREEMAVRPRHLFESVGALGDATLDYVFVCTKACALDSLLNEMSSEIKSSPAVFVSFQNGIDTEQILAEQIGRRRVLRGVVSYAGVLLDSGEVRETFFDPPNYIGWLENDGEGACRELADLLSASGLLTEATADIQKFVWRKAILNSCTMSIAAITGMNIQEMINFPPTAGLVELLLNESIAVAAAYGFDFGAEFVEQVKKFNKRAGPHRPSMLVDIEKGRKTENFFLMHRIADYAERRGVPAPIHRALAVLIDALEARSMQVRNYHRAAE